MSWADEAKGSSFFMTTRTSIVVALSTVLLGACGSSIPNVTGSLFGGAAAPAQPQQPTSDPMSRAVQVGTTSARAVKCGFNFDPVKLRTQFLATESVSLTNPGDVSKIGQAYDIGFNGVSKAVAAQGEDYCNSVKTAKIKEALNRHLTGDYTPAAPEPVVEEEGIFGSLSSSSSTGYRDSNPMRRDE
jgi:hypothetical protein